MNGLWWEDYVNNSPRIAAWSAHYEARGCSARKAYDLACLKVRAKQSWPPRA